MSIYEKQSERVLEKDRTILELLKSGVLKVDTLGAEVKYKERSLPQTECPNGYLRVSIPGLGVDGGSCRVRVHRIVALAASGVIDQGLEVGHIDHDKSNNCHLNLVRCSRSDNVLQSFRTGNRARIRKGRRLSLEQIADIRRRHSLGESIGSLSRSFGVSLLSVKTWLTKDPLLASRRGREFDLIGPDGQRHIGRNITAFCKLHGLSLYRIRQLIREGRHGATVDGWRNARPSAELDRPPAKSAAESVRRLVKDA